MTVPSNYQPPMISTANDLTKSARRSITFILASCAVMFVLLQGGLTWLNGKVDSTWAAIGVTAVVLIIAFLCQHQLSQGTISQSALALGYGRSKPQAILVAFIITSLMLAFFPLFSLVTGIPISLKSDWLWVLLGIVILNGFGEETLFRGYVFGNLRKVGFSFNRAGFISMVIFAAVHLFLFLQNPFIIGMLGILIAIAAAFPMAYLFERGGNTIWAAVIVHVGTHLIRLVDMPEASYMTAVTVWLVLQLGLPFLILAFRNNLLRA